MLKSSDKTQIQCKVHSVSIGHKLQLVVFVFIAEARMRSKAMKREALQAAKEAKKERGE